MCSVDDLFMLCCNYWPGVIQKICLVQQHQNWDDGNVTRMTSSQRENVPRKIEKIEKVELPVAHLAFCID